MHTIIDKKLLMLRPEEIRTNSNYNREYNEYELKLLSCSIATIGVVEPILVRRDHDGNYILVSGGRRLKASIMAGLRRVPCILHKIDSATAAIFSVAENLQRKNLPFFDGAKAVSNLINEFGFSHSETSAALGIPQAELASKLGLLKLDCILQERITMSELTEQYVRTLFRLPGIMRDEALDMIIAENMTPKQAEDYVNRLLNPKTEQPKPEEKPLRKIAIGDVRLFSNSLSKLILTMQNAGVNASFRKYETDRYIEFKIKITKEQQNEHSAEQLKIC